MEISKDKNLIIQSEFIERRIFIIRGRKVMIDDDLAEFVALQEKLGYAGKDPRWAIEYQPNGLTRQSSETVVVSLRISCFN